MNNEELENKIKELEEENYELTRKIETMKESFNTIKSEAEQAI